MTRFPDWAGRLECYLSAQRRERFQYGRLDCALFAANAIRAMTGTDIAAWFRGRYSTRLGALENMRTYTRGKSSSVQVIAAVVASEFGMPEVDVLMAQRGDLLLIRRARDYSLGLLSLNGRNMAVLTRQGVGFVPLKAERAWRV